MNMHTGMNVEAAGVTFAAVDKFEDESGNPGAYAVGDRLKRGRPVANQ
jgi:hypothetical protein